MGMNWRKGVALFLTSVLTASLLAACGGGSAKKEEPPQGGGQQTAGDKKVELEFWGWWSSETRMPTINKIVDKWNQEHPNIQVKYSFVPFGEIETKYLASVAAKNPPDVVIHFDIFGTPRRAQKKQAMDLSSLGADAFKDEYYPEYWKAVQYEGKAYGLPWTGETKYLYYNKALFREAGLDPEKGPVTWDDLWTYADKLDVKDGKKLVRAGFHPNFGNFEYQGWVWNAKSTFFDGDKPVVNSEKNAEVLDWMKKWTDRYGFEAYSAMKGSFGNGPQHPFIQQKAAMITETATFEGELKKNAPNLEYGIVPVPTIDGKQHQTASYTGGFVAEIPVGAKHPKEALEFAKYWTTEAAVIWAQEQNDFPAYKKAVETITTPQFKRMADNMANTGLIPVPLAAPTYKDALTVAIDDVLSGKKDSKKALDEAQAAIEKMIKENTAK